MSWVYVEGLTEPIDEVMCITKSLSIIRLRTLYTPIGWCTGGTGMSN